jgi:hypothetical protein
VFKKIGLFAALAILTPAALLAQSQKTAVGGDASLWAGGEASYFDPDYSCTGGFVWNCSRDMWGAGAVVDFNLRPKWGVEGDARWLHWNGIGGQVESSYMAGPRYRLYRHNRLDLWSRVGVGGGWITTPYYPAAGSLKGSYFAFAPGGSIDYRVTHRLALRADYEYQFWPSFAGPPTITPTAVKLNNGGLTPNGFSLGILYRFLGQ